MTVVPVVIFALVIAIGYVYCVYVCLFVFGELRYRAPTAAPVRQSISKVDADC